MSVEAGVLIDMDGNPIHWHLPPNRNGGSLPDSRDLWDIIWENRSRISGFAHSHPGYGVPGPSYEDVSTFAAIEAALGKRLVWWIISANAWAEFSWAGPDKYAYKMVPVDNQVPEWVIKLREFSLYFTDEFQPIGE